MSGKLVKVDRAYIARIKDDKFARAFASVRNWKNLEALAAADGMPRGKSHFLEMPVMCECGMARSLGEAFGSDGDGEIMVCEGCDRLYWEREFCIALRALMLIGWEGVFNAILSVQEWNLIYPVPRVRT